MIWNSTNYFNNDFVTETGITEKQYEEKTTFLAYAVILGVTHTLGESDSREDLQDWLDKWKADEKKSADDAKAVRMKAKADAKAAAAEAPKAGEL